MKRSKGFTLIELLIVIVLLGVLIALGLASYMSTMKKSRDSKRKSDLRQLAVTLEAYFNDKGHYPLMDSGETAAFMGCPDDTSPCGWGVSLVDANGTMYMQTIPVEGLSSQRYYYVSTAYSGHPAGSYFQLYARLENTLDGDIPKSGATSRVFSDMNCGTAIATLHCNYGVSSSNVQVITNRTVSYE